MCACCANCSVGVGRVWLSFVSRRWEDVSVFLARPRVREPFVFHVWHSLSLRENVCGCQIFRIVLAVTGLDLFLCWSVLEGDHEDRVVSPFLCERNCFSGSQLTTQTYGLHLGIYLICNIKPELGGTHLGNSLFRSLSCDLPFESNVHKAKVYPSHIIF